MSTSLLTQTGSMSNVFGTKVGEFYISKPAPPVSDEEAWQKYTEDVESGKYLQPVYKPNKMEYQDLASEDPSYEGAPFTVAPRFQIVDDQVCRRLSLPLSTISLFRHSIVLLTKQMLLY